MEACEYDPRGTRVLLTGGRDGDAGVNFGTDDTATRLGRSLPGNSFSFTGALRA